MYWMFKPPYLIFSHEENKSFVFFEEEYLTDGAIIKVINYFNVEKYQQDNLSESIEIISLDDYKKKLLRSTTTTFAINVVEKLINNTIWIKIPSTSPTNLALIDSIDAALNNCDTSLVICACCYRQAQYIIPEMEFALENSRCKFKMNLKFLDDLSNDNVGAINFGFLGYLKNGVYSKNVQVFQDGDYRYNFKLTSGERILINVTYYFTLNNGVITIKDFINDSLALGVFDNPFVQGTYNFSNDFIWYPFIGSSETIASDYIVENQKHLGLFEVFRGYGVLGGVVQKTYQATDNGDFSGFRMFKMINGSWVEQKGYIYKSGKWLKCFKT